MSCCERTISGLEESSASEIVAQDLTVTNDTTLNNLTVTGTTTLTGPFDVDNLVADTLTVSGASTLATVTGSGRMRVTDTTNYIDPNNASFITDGGAYVKKDLTVSGTAIIAGPTTFTVRLEANSANSGSTANSGAIAAPLGGISCLKDAGIGGKVNVGSTDDTTGAGTGSIQTLGGAYITKTLDAQDVAVRNNIACLGTVAADSVDANTGTIDLITSSSLTASSAVQTDASKNLVSVANTGTGSNVLGTAPTITNATLVTPTITGMTSISVGTLDATTVNTTNANTTNLNVSSLGTNQSLATDLLKNVISIPNTGTGNNVLGFAPTITNATLANPTITGLGSLPVGTLDATTVNTTNTNTTNLNLSSATASQSVQTNGSKNLVTIANTGTGSNVLDTTPTISTATLIGTTTAATINAANITADSVDADNGNFATISSSTLTASSAVQTNGLNELVSIANTGTGSNVLGTAPTITNATLVTPTITGVTSINVGTLDATTVNTTNTNTTNLNVSSATASQSLQTDASKNVVSIANTGTGSNVLGTAPTITNATLVTSTADTLTATVGITTLDATITSASASQAVQTNASKKLVTIANTGTGDNVLTNLPTITSPSIIGDTTVSGNLTTTRVKGSSVDNATSATTGAVQAIFGGIGCLKDVWAGEKVIANSTEDYSGANTGSLQTIGGAYIAKGLGVSGTTILAGPTTYTVRVEANSANSGSGANDGAIAAPLGGISCLKDIYAGGNHIGTKLISTSTENATIVGTGGVQTLGGISAAKDIFSATHMTATDYFFTGTSGGVYGGTHYGTGSANATSAATGSFQTPGGIGCGQDVWAGGKLLANSTVDSTSIGTGSIITPGGISCAKTLYTQDLVVLGTSSVPTTSQLDFTATSGQNATSASTGAFRAQNGGIGCALDVWAGGKLLPQSTVDATSPTTGSIITPGGIGSDKTIWAGTAFKTLGDVFANGSVFTVVAEGSSTQNATSATTGAIRATAGGIGCSKDVWVGQKVICNSSANSNSITTGALIVSDGGIGCKKNTYVGGHGHFAAAENSTSAADGAVHAPNGGIGCALDAWIGGRVIANSTADATNLTDGAIRSLGGLSVLKNLVMGGVLQNEIVQNATSAVTGAIRAINGGISCALDIWAGGDIYSNSPTASTSTTTGAIRTLGGIGAGGAVYAGGKLVTTNTTNSTSTTTGSIITPGGIGCAQDIQAGGKVVVPTTGSFLSNTYSGYYWDGAANSPTALISLTNNPNTVTINLLDNYTSVLIRKQVSGNGTVVNLNGGTWTPTISTTPVAISSYITQTGYYQDNGKMRTYYILLEFTQPTVGVLPQVVYVDNAPGFTEIAMYQGQGIFYNTSAAQPFTQKGQLQKRDTNGLVLVDVEGVAIALSNLTNGDFWRISMTGSFYRP